MSVRRTIYGLISIVLSLFVRTPVCSSVCQQDLILAAAIQGTFFIFGMHIYKVQRFLEVNVDHLMTLTVTPADPSGGHNVSQTRFIYHV